MSGPGARREYSTASSTYRMASRSIQTWTRLSCATERTTVSTQQCCICLVPRIYCCQNGNAQLLIAILVVLPEPPGVQIFTLEGEFVSSWFSHRACGVCVSGKSIYIAELGTHSTVHGFGQWADYSRWTPNIGNKISILTSAGEQVQRLGADSVGERPDEFLASLHSVAVNSKGDIYAAEVSFVNGGGAMQAPAREMQSLHKWERLPA